MNTNSTMAKYHSAPKGGPIHNDVPQQTGTANQRTLMRQMAETDAVLTDCLTRARQALAQLFGHEPSNCATITDDCEPVAPREVSTVQDLANDLEQSAYVLRRVISKLERIG